MSLCAGPLRGPLGFQLPTMSTGWADRVLAGFHFQILWELLFLAQGPWALEPGEGLGHLHLLGGPSPVRCLSQCLTTIYGFGVSPFRLSAPPISLNVASSLHP